MLLAVVIFALSPVHWANAQLPEGSDGLGAFLETGDFNGDGYSDLVIGVPFEDLEKSEAISAGAIHVIYGSDDRLVDKDDQFWHRNILGVEGTADGPSTTFGSEAAACDFNGDGYDDLAIGAQADALYGKKGAGSVNVLYGSDLGLTTIGDQLWLQGMLSVPDFPERSDFFGAALVGGDFNDDTYCDLAIGVPNEMVHEPATNTHIEEGIVHVLNGTAAGLTDIDNQVWSLENTLGERQDNNLNFGHDLAVGDFNGDGVDDLAIAAPNYDMPGAKDVGTIIVLHGVVERGLDDAYQLLQSGIGLAGPAEMDRLGYCWWPRRGCRSLATGDYDQNGADDLAVGGMTDGYKDWGEGIGDDPLGSVSVFFGGVGLGLLESQMQLWVPGHFGNWNEQTNIHFGGSLAVGDFDGDQIDDLAIGADWLDNVGGIAVLHGVKYAGLTLDQVQIWGQGDPYIWGSPSLFQHWGFMLAAGDFDKNGRDDLAIGAPDADVILSGGLFVEVYQGAGEVNVLYAEGSGGLSAENSQLWYQGLPGLDGDGMLNPGVENVIEHSREDKLLLDEKAFQDKHVFSLQSNFPNPFKAGTTIQFTLEEGSESASLDIFDMTGKRVRSLFAGTAAGSQRIEWDGRDDVGRQLAAGVYMIRLQQADRVATQVTTLLR